jgi:hypothetical protein
LARTFFTAAEEISSRPPVVVERPLQGATTATDVEHERHVALLERRPEPVVVRMRGRHTGAGVGWHENGVTARVERLVEHRLRSFGRRPLCLAHGHEPRVGGAELRYRAVVCPEATVDEFAVVAEVLRGSEGREHQLAVEPEQVERSAALGGIERAEGVPALLRQELGLQRQRSRLIAATRLRSAHRVIGHRPRAPEVERTDPVTNGGIGIARKPVRQLHDVAVGVVDLAPAGITGCRDHDVPLALGLAVTVAAT